VIISPENRAVFTDQLRNRRGRRPAFGSAATVVITVRVTEAQRADLRRVAAVNQTDVAGAIRDAVDGYVSDFRDNDPVFRRS
jgi:hypothetical protein